MIRAGGFMIRSNKILHTRFILVRANLSVSLKNLETVEIQVFRRDKLKVICLILADCPVFGEKLVASRGKMILKR
jgi:hypothetical protein